MAAYNQISGITLTLCSLLSLALLAQGVALNRNQRQTIASELATGLTGTGTSFNSLYNNVDQFQFQQQQLDQPNLIGDYGAHAAGRRPMVGGSFTSNYNVNRYDGIYNDPLSPTYNQVGGGVGGVGGSSWSGFGYGKAGRGSGGRLPVGGAYGGVKY